MFRRLFAAFVALLLLALGLAGFLAARSTRERILRDVESRLRAESRLLKSIVRARPSSEELQQTLSGLARTTETRLTVIAADGSVVADSHGDPGRMENQNTRQEVLDARRVGHAATVRFSGLARSEMLYYAEPLDDADRAGTVVRAALGLTRISDELYDLYLALAIVLPVVAAAGALVTWVATRWIMRPLREIRSVAEAIARGDFSRRAPLTGRDEIASMTLAIHRMADELTARMESLRAESSKLDAILASMREGVIAVDRDGGVLHCNREACELFGLALPPTGLRVWEIVRHPELQPAIREVLDGRPEAGMELEIGGRVVSVRVTPVRNRGGAVLVAHDSTEEARYHALRREFVANVSHEMRTPLSLVLGYVETLRAGALADPARANEFLATIETHARRLAAIVEDLLDLSRLESGAQAVRPRSVDVPSFVSKVADALRPLAEKRGHELILQTCPVDLVADPDLLDRAISNLVDNAIKYTPEGGRIRLSARAERDDIVFEVEDNGIGIPEADQPRIFERFYRVDRSRSRELGGTGLGLAIVKHVAQLHGGAVSVDSRPGVGSRFTLRIPRRLPGAS